MRFFQTCPFFCAALVSALIFSGAARADAPAPFSDFTGSYRIVANTCDNDGAQTLTVAYQALPPYQTNEVQEGPNSLVLTFSKADVLTTSWTLTERQENLGEGHFLSDTFIFDAQALHHYSTTNGGGREISLTRAAASGTRILAKSWHMLWSSVDPCTVTLTEID